MIRKPNALFFDLDGTLVDSRGDIAASCNAALVAHGRAALSEAAIALMVGDGARALVARALGVFEGPIVDEVVVSFEEHYLAHPCVHTTLLPGAREVLEEAKALAIPCALITNKPRAIALLLLEALGVAPMFAAVWGGGDGPMKPAPDALLTMAGRLGVDPHDSWMIGDGPQDVGAGKAAGAFTVGVAGIADHALLRAAGPDAEYASLHDVVAALRATAG